MNYRTMLKLQVVSTANTRFHREDRLLLVHICYPACYHII